jgi:ubiquinone biosynthesis monooxygenase Coq7
MNLVDRLIVGFDNGLRTLAAQALSSRPHPDGALPEADLSDAERRHSASLMRVNHTGEICAQALYAGQALTARDAEVRDVLAEAGREEVDHLAWTQRRIEALGGRTSVLNPLFYAGSFALGALSGLAGDRWNLGFLAETERQVESHLRDHLGRLPDGDAKSRAVLEQMRDDEARHARTALDQGGASLPEPVQAVMKAASRIMTATTYRV